VDLRFKVTLGRHHEDWTRRNPLQPCCLNPVFKANWEFSERQPQRCIQATKQALASALGRFLAFIVQSAHRRLLSVKRPFNREFV